MEEKLDKILEHLEFISAHVRKQLEEEKAELERDKAIWDDFSARLAKQAKERQDKND